VPVLTNARYSFCSTALLLSFCYPARGSCSRCDGCLRTTHRRRFVPTRYGARAWRRRRDAGGRMRLLRPDRQHDITRRAAHRSLQRAAAGCQHATPDLFCGCGRCSARSFSARSSCSAHRRVAPDNTEQRAPATWRHFVALRWPPGNAPCWRAFAGTRFAA